NHRRRDLRRARRTDRRPGAADHADAGPPAAPPPRRQRGGLSGTGRASASQGRRSRVAPVAGARAAGGLSRRGHQRAEPHAAARLFAPDRAGVTRMIGTLLRIFWIHLRRDRVVWVLTFFVPVAFFSIFAAIFSGQGRGSTPVIRVAVVDEDGSDFSKKLVAALEKDRSLRVSGPLESSEEGPGNSGTPLGRQDAEALVRDGKVSAAIILPQGLGRSFLNFAGDRPRIEVLADTSDPVAPEMLSGMLQGLAMTAAPDALMKGGIEQFRKWGGELTPEQKKAVEQAEQLLKQPPAGNGQGGGGPASGLVAVKVVDVLGQEKANPVVAF